MNAFAEIRNDVVNGMGALLLIISDVEDEEGIDVSSSSGSI